MQESVTEHVVTAEGSTAVLFEGTVAECLDWARARVQRGDVEALHIMGVTVALEHTVRSSASVKSLRKSAAAAVSTRKSKRNRRG